MKLNDIIKSTIKLYDYIKEQRLRNREARNQELDLALVAVQNAANETRLYLNSIAKGKKTDKNKEKELSNLWKIVGFSLRGIDSELSMVTFEKSDYWLDPSSYNLVEIDEVNMGLQHVVKEAKILLQR